VQDDPTLANYNKDLKCMQIVNYTQSVANGQRNDENVMILLGDDFSHSNAYATFKNTDKMIQIANECQDLNMTFKYSTPMQYVNSLKKENTKWPIKYGDFLPYYESEKQHSTKNHFSFWSGYYTSRPTFKKMIRDASSLLYAQNKMFARKVIDQDATSAEIKEVMSASSYLFDQVSVVQHHDAISGTAAQYVTLDYEYRL